MSTAELHPRREPLRELAEAFSTVTQLLLQRGVGLDDALSMFASGYIRSALSRNGGNMTQAAAALGIHRNTLRARLQKNGQKLKGTE